MFSKKTKRIYSIDVFRGITMFFMIFVNDFWTLEGIPQWLKHMPAQADGLGFSDIIFPAFLFIVGLSIPYAIDNRQRRESIFKTFQHIVSRSVALIVMGVYLVNLENMHPEAMSISKILWQVLVIVAFFLIWNNYKLSGLSRNIIKVLVGFGILILLVLAVLYRGGDAEEIKWMQHYWWGILGLIGWAYFYCATIYLWSGGNLVMIVGAAVFFLLYNFLSELDLLPFMEIISAGTWFGNASNQALVMGGVVTSTLYKMQQNKGHGRVVLTFLSLGVLILVIGFFIEAIWGNFENQSHSFVGEYHNGHQFAYLCIFLLAG